MANFCGKCGADLDTATGLCPNCDREQLNVTAAENAAADTSDSCPGSAMDEQTGLCPNSDCSNGETDTNVTLPKDIDESKPKKSKSKALTTVITVILSVCLFLTLLLAIVIYDVRNAVKDDNVEELFDSFRVDDFINNAEVVDDSDLEIFYDLMKINYGIELADHQLNSFINKTTAKEFFADKIADFCDDFFEGEAELTINKREIANLFQKNSKAIKDEFGVKLTDYDYRNIADWILDEDEFVIISTATVKDSAPALYYILTIGLSYVTMAFFIIISALFVFLMIKNSFSQAVCGVGIDFIIFGGLTGLVAMLAAWIPPLWELICADSFIGIAIGNFMAVNALISVILLVLGVAMLVIRGLIIKHRVNNQGEKVTKKEAKPV